MKNNMPSTREGHLLLVLWCFFVSIGSRIQLIWPRTSNRQMCRLESKQWFVSVRMGWAAVDLCVNTKSGNVHLWTGALTFFFNMFYKCFDSKTHLHCKRLLIAFQAVCMQTKQLKKICLCAAEQVSLFAAAACWHQLHTEQFISRLTWVYLPQSCGLKVSISPALSQLRAPGGAESRVFAKVSSTRFSSAQLFYYVTTRHLRYVVAGKYQPGSPNNPKLETESLAADARRHWRLLLATAAAAASNESLWNILACKKEGNDCSR